MRDNPDMHHLRNACALALLLTFAIPAAAQPTRSLTPPKEALGFNIGDDYQVANYTQLAA